MRRAARERGSSYGRRAPGQCPPRRVGRSQQDRAPAAGTLRGVHGAALVGAARRRATRSGFGEPDVAETPAVLGLTLPRVLIAPATFEQGTGLCQATPRRRPAPRPLPGGPVRPPPPSAGRRARWRQQVPRSCLAGGVDLPARSPAPCRFPGLFAVYP